MKCTRRLKRLIAFGSVILIVFGVSACGDAAQEAVVETATTNEPPPPNVTPQVPGFGPVTIRVRGTAVKQGAGTIYTGDCDDMSPDDDFEVMTFSAPWSIVGFNQAGFGAAMGGGITRGFEFTKGPDAANVRLLFTFGLEKSNATAAMLTDGLPRVADIAFADGTVGLFRVTEPRELVPGYAAVFPIVQKEGMPAEPEFTSRHIARVQLISLSLPEFNGWSEAEIIKLFESFYTERCLGDGLERALAPFAPKMSYE